MTIGGWGQENRHITDGLEVITRMILDYFILRAGYTEVLLWGSYWMTGDLIWTDGQNFNLHFHWLFHNFSVKLRTF